MTVIQEGHLHFFFPEEWQLIKYDVCRFQRQKALKCQNTKAVNADGNRKTVKIS